MNTSLGTYIWITLYTEYIFICTFTSIPEWQRSNHEVYVYTLSIAEGEELYFFLPVDQPMHRKEERPFSCKSRALLLRHDVKSLLVWWSRCGQRCGMERASEAGILLLVCLCFWYAEAQQKCQTVKDKRCQCFPAEHEVIDIANYFPYPAWVRCHGVQPEIVDS